MKDLLDALKTMDTSTLVILGFAALLLLFLLVLIVVTIKILRTNYEIEETEEQTGKPVLLDEDDEEDDDVEEETEDETSKMVREAVESVEGTMARVEAEKIAREAEEAAKSAEEAARTAAAIKAQEIADSVQGIKNQAAQPSPAISMAGGISDSDDDYDDEYDDEYEDDSDYNKASDAVDPDGATGELDTTKIRNALKKVRAEAMESGENSNILAKNRAEAPEYNASFDSAFVERPAYEEKIEPVIPNPTPESILGSAPVQPMQPAGPDPNMLGQQGNVAQSGTSNQMPMQTPVQPVGPQPDMLSQPGMGMPTQPVGPQPDMLSQPGMGIPSQPGMMPQGHAEGTITVNPVNIVAEPTEEQKEEVKEFLEENPKPEKTKKRKTKKKPFESKKGSSDGDTKVAQYFWYNTQDIEGLARKEDMYFKCHYFNSADDVILEIITEMYDCGYVRTEELQRIAYGITFKSLGMKQILKSEENLGFDKDKAVKEPSESDKAESYEKWCQYVNNFREILVINAPDEVVNYIMQSMYEYGHKDIEELMYSPY